MSERRVGASAVVAAPPQAVFDLLADPRAHARFDGSGTVRAAVAGPPRLSAGARFGMAMRWGVPYRIRNTVVEFEEGRRIAWRHFGKHVWRYELEPAAGGTKIRDVRLRTRAVTMVPRTHRRPEPQPGLDPRHPWPPHRDLRATADRVAVTPRE